MNGVPYGVFIGTNLRQAGYYNGRVYYAGGFNLQRALFLLCRV